MQLISCPTITVVTVTYNSERHLEETIRSVISQNHPSFEYIIIDGGSTDNTLRIIEAYQRHLTHWISEPDQGIADAMNKGLEVATGDYLLFLHSDDFLRSKHSLEAAYNYLDGDHEIFAFDILYGRESHYEKRPSKGFSAWMNFKTGLFHQGVICSRSVFDTIGGFDTQFSIAIDYDFFLRAYKQGFKVKNCRYVLSVMRDTGLSSRSDWPSLKTRFDEEQRVHSKNSSSNAMRLVYFLYWLAYPKYRYLLRILDRP